MLRAGCGSPSESPNRNVWFVTLRGNAHTRPAPRAGLSEIEPGPEPLRVRCEGGKPADYGGRRGRWQRRCGRAPLPPASSSDE